MGLFFNNMCTIDYYPGGMLQIERSFRSTEYRFGFNKGSEKDDEINGSGTNFTTKFREGDTRLLRWWSLDPKADLQPWQSPYSYMDGNLILMNDPEGDCPWCIGALIGAALDVGLQLTEIALDDKKSLSDFSITSVGVSAAAGAVGVGIATKLDKALKVANIASKTTTTIIKVTSNSVTDAATSAASQKIQTGEVNTSEVLIDVVAGGTVGKIAGDAAEKAAKNSPVGKTLMRQADRAERVAGNNPRPSRQAASESTKKKAENHAVSRGAAAGTAASGAASETIKKVAGVDEKQ